VGEGWHQPWSVQVEFVEGCSRLCAFCGLNALRSKPGDYRCMTVETAALVASGVADLCPGARLEFAMHGEPLMHPRYLELIALFRAMLPRVQLQVTTNGVRFRNGKMQQRVDELFAAGITFIMLDTYYPERDELRMEARKLRGVRVVDFYEEDVRPYYNDPRKMQRTVVLLDDLGARSGERASRVILNHAGSNPLAPPVLEPLAKKCTLPFRELSICYDGAVNVCCMDWTRRYTCGQVSPARSLRDIWWGPEFAAARAMLGNRDRRFGSCRYCSVGSGMRSGLLPKTGPVTAEHRETISRVEAEGVARAYGRR
jgi:hypothetical protein